MKSLWLHLRTSPARWAFVPLTLLGVAILFGRSRFWIGIWPETGAAAQVSAFFLSSFAAGVAAWISAQAKTRGMHEQFAAATVSPFRIELTRLAATLLWTIAPYLVVAAVGFSLTAGTFPPGVTMFVGYMLLGAALPVLATAWGWLAGRLLTPQIAAISALLSWFILASIVIKSADGVQMSGPPWMQIHLGTVSLRLAAAIAFAGAVCALPWPPGRLRPRPGQIAAVAAGAIGVLAANMSTTVISPRPPVADPLCVRGTIEYCLWPEHAKYADLVKTVDARLAALPVRLPLPDRMVDYALSGSVTWVDDETSIELPGHFAPEFDISEGSQWALARGIARAVEQTVFADCVPEVTPDPQRRRDQLFAWLEARLAGGGLPDYATNAPGGLQQAWAAGHNMAAEQSAQTQADWVTGLIAVVKAQHCHAQ